MKAKLYVIEAYRWAVDLDREKLFDRVNPAKPTLAQRISDKRMLKLIRAFLAWRGGPLSPFLSNIVIDELDRKLEQRGVQFVRYADCTDAGMPKRQIAPKAVDR